MFSFRYDKLTEINIHPLSVSPFSSRVAPSSAGNSQSIYVRHMAGGRPIERLWAQRDQRIGNMFFRKKNVHGTILHRTSPRINVDGVGPFWGPY